MIIYIEHNSQKFIVNTKDFIDLSIPYNFDGPQPNFYDVSPGRLNALKIKHSSYLVSEGAGCNVPEVSLNIHCTGTHTEYVGHLLDVKGAVSSYIQDIIMPAGLITVESIPFIDCQDNYHVNVNEMEAVICKKNIELQFQKLQKNKITTLVIRTLPNPIEKKYYSYSKNIPPFFTNDAIIFLIENNIQHLVVDLPSIDRMQDDGILGNHRIFWSKCSDPESKVSHDSLGTITELAYIPNHVKDGFYFLNIQTPHFQCDAAPSRPILIKPS